MNFISEIPHSIDTSDILDELESKEEAWTLDTSRQRKYKSQQDTETIFLRSVQKPFPANVPPDSGTNQVHPSRETSLAKDFPEAMKAAAGIASLVDGELGRVMLVKLKPGGRIPAHSDNGDYFRVRHRFQLLLTSNDGVSLACRDEHVTPVSGQLIWCDNKEQYEESNQGTTPTVRLIVDVLPTPVSPFGKSVLRNFCCVRRNINVASLLKELDADPAIWELDTSRQDRTEVQRETNNVMLRGALKPIPEGCRINDVHPSRDGKAASLCPAIMDWLRQCANDLGGELCRALIARLNPNGQIYSHIDGGEYYKIRDRYHLVLRSLGGSKMVIGDERTIFRDGELWWFNNKVPHEAFNESIEGRIHLIFDVFPFKPPHPHLYNAK